MELLEAENILLNHIAQVVPLNSSEKDKILHSFQLKNWKKKEFLLPIGEVCKYEYFLVKGVARTYYLDDKGNEHVVMLSMEEWWVGDLQSFHTQSPSMYGIQALEPVCAWVINKEELEKLYESIPSLNIFFRKKLQNAFMAVQQRIAEQASLDANTRYQQFLQKHPVLNQRVAQKYVASYLGITPEFLSMLRKAKESIS